MEKIKNKVKHRKKRATKCASWDQPIQPQNSFVQNAMSQLKCTVAKQWKQRDKTPLQPNNSLIGNPRLSAPHSERRILPFTYWQKECKPINHINLTQKIKSGDNSRRFSSLPIQDRIHSCKLGHKGISPVCYYRKNEIVDHELSLSEIMHMDIRPNIRKNLLTIHTQENKKPTAANAKPHK